MMQFEFLFDPFDPSDPFDPYHSEALWSPGSVGSFVLRSFTHRQSGESCFIYRKPFPWYRVRPAIIYGWPRISRLFVENISIAARSIDPETSKLRKWTEPRQPYYFCSIFSQYSTLSAGNHNFSSRLKVSVINLNPRILNDNSVHRLFEVI